MKKNGFTLIEAVVAIVILAVLLLGLLTALSVVIDNNIRTKLRNNAVKIAQQCLEVYRSKPYSSIPTGDPGFCNDVSLKIGNKTYTFTVDENVQDIPSANDTKKVTIDVRWNYKSKNYSYTVESFISQLN